MSFKPLLVIDDERFNRLRGRFARRRDLATQDEKRNEPTNAAQIVVREPHCAPITAAATPMLCELFKRLLADFIESNFGEGKPRGEMAGAIVIALYRRARMAKCPKFGGKCRD